jgi:hypothetical protein
LRLGVRGGAHLGRQRREEGFVLVNLLLLTCSVSELKLSGSIFLPHLAVA